MLSLHDALPSLHRMLDMLALDPARLAPEGQEHQPPAVETGQQRGHRAQPEGEIAELRPARKGNFEDRILRMEACKPGLKPVNAHTSYRKCARHHRPECEQEIGSASSRERVGQYGKISVGAVSIKKKP